MSNMSNMNPLGAMRPRTSIFGFFGELNWTIILLATALGLVGVAMLYSVSGGVFETWALSHLTRLIIGLVLALVIASISIRFWYQMAYFIYAAILISLILLEFFGSVSMGARRWLDLEILSIQPSEFMRIGLMLALARYYQGIYQDMVSNPLRVIIPLLLIGAPCLLILRQPDLGTMVLFAAAGIGVMFLAGLNIRYFIGGAASLLVMVPVAWQVFLHPYQRTRILTFLNPERDPLGAGYHIIQSKIGIGSGGVLGKGFAQGSQTRLNFLPENHTDFIFTVIAEELGFAGAMGLIALYFALLVAIFAITRRVRSQFSRLLSAGLGMTLFIYLAVNLSMAMGLAPVVGVPLPFISYGGTSLITFLVSIGFLLTIDRNANVDISRG